MNFVYIGELVNTHGLKGEVKIISDFKEKDKVFKVGNKIYTGINYDCLEITSYRRHQNYDMVTFKGLDKIEDVVIYKGDIVYVNRDDYDFGIINEDLIGLSVYGNDYIGKVTGFLKSNAHELLVIENEGSKHYVTYIDEFIKKIDLDNKKIIINEIEGLIDEN